MKKHIHWLYSHWFVAACLTAVGILLYANTFDVGFRFDGHEALQQDRYIRSFTWVLTGGTAVRKLPFLTFALNYHLNGFAVPGWHAVNLLVHILAAVFVFGLVRLIFKTPAMKDRAAAVYGGRIAFFSALIFLCHPIQTQSVTYIYQRITAMAGLFYLATVFFYLKARLKHGRVFILMAAVSFLAAIFSKESAYTLPAAILLAELCFIERSGRKILRNLLLFAFTCLLLASIFLICYRGHIEKEGFAAIFNRAGWDISAGTYLLTQFSVLVNYLRLLFVPVAQNVDHDVLLASGVGEPRIWGSFLVLFSLLCFAAARFHKNPILSFGIFLFFLTLSISSSVIPLPDIMFEHRLYLPMTGFAIALPVILLRFIRNLRIWMAVMLVFITCLSIATLRRNEIWRDEVRLWSDAAKKSPGKARVFHNLGKSLMERERFMEAVAAFRRAVQLEPEMASAHASLAAALVSAGHMDEAIEHLLECVQRGRVDALIYKNLGMCLLSKGEAKEAEAYFRLAVDLKLMHFDAMNGLGIALASQGKLDEAIEWFAYLVELEPEHEGVRYNLEMVLKDKEAAGAAASNAERN